MEITDYINAGASAKYFVPDLVPSKGHSISLVLVFESPHKQEIEARLPVVGATGRRALAYLSPDAFKQHGSLGRYVDLLDAIGNSGIAVMNVASVPLQGKAFSSQAESPLSDEQWVFLDRLRKAWSTTAPLSANQPAGIADAVAAAFRTRFDRLDLADDYAVVPWGGIARRFTSFVQLDRLPRNDVPHPATPKWQELVESEDAGLTEARRRVLTEFAMAQPGTAA